MHLFLLRHGDADSSPTTNDNERPLSYRGKQEIELVAQFLQRSKIRIDVIVSSPLARAKETASIIQSINQIEKLVVTEYLVPESNHNLLFKEITDMKVPTLLLVGHEPQLSALISILTSGNEQSNIEVRKGSLAFLAVQKPIHPGTGLLRWILPVSILSSLQ